MRSQALKVSRLAHCFGNQQAILNKAIVSKNPLSISNRRNAHTMLSWYWPLPSGDRALSRVDPFRLNWPDEFDRMARELEDDMWRRHAILDAIDSSMWRDYMLFFNNPGSYQIEPGRFKDELSSSVEHYQNGKEYTFKRSVTVNGKTDTVTAKYDGEKTLVTYDGNKTLELPGFYDITVDVVKKGSDATRAIDDKLEEMNKQLRGETQSTLEGGKQGQQQQIEGGKQQQQQMSGEKHQQTTAHQQQQQQQQREPQQAS